MKATKLVAASLRSDIFPHYLFLETRRLLGLFQDRTISQQKLWLRAALNLSILMCEDRVMLPFGAAIECDIAYSLLEEQRVFFQARLIYSSMRESSVGELIEKKRIEYAPMRETHLGLFDDRRVKFLSDNALAISRRATKIGETIKENWENKPDTRDPTWRSITRSLSASQVDSIREIPGQLIESNFAVAWEPLKRHLPSISLESNHLIRRALLREFFLLYIKEYSLNAIGRIPIIVDDLDIGRTTRVLDFERLERAFRIIHLDDLIFDSNPERITLLKFHSKFVTFIDAISELEKAKISGADFLFLFDRAARQMKFDWRGHRLTRSAHLDSYQEGGLVELVGALENLALILISENGLQTRLTSSKTFKGGSLGKSGVQLESRDMTTSTSKIGDAPIVLYVALREELDILVRRLKLSKGADQPAAHGTIGGMPIEIICPNSMGRVAAAVEMTLYLSKRNVAPKLILVAGLAGGFPENGTSVGHIIVGSFVVDMATRKIRDGKNSEGIHTEFRRRDYPLSNAIDRVLNSDLFAREEWLEEAIDYAEWPKDRRPSLHEGLLACGDEVVSSDEWRKDLLTATPKLLGLEMESGGVCAAAERYKIPVCVIRTVSDGADPSKKDDDWRKIGMKTIAVLLEKIDLEQVLARV